MQRSDIPILIVEDDESSGKAMKAVLTRQGYEVKLARGAHEATAAFKIGEYRAVILDCMIPQKNGVELGEQFRKDSSNDLLIVLVSGIYKDKGFMRDAIRRTGAKDFLIKPLDVESLVQIVDDYFIDELDEEREPLVQILNMKDLPTQRRIEAIKATEYVHGFDLPLVYSLLIGTDISGELKITTSEEESAVISFSNGNIVKVDAKDDRSYFGVLLVEKGFTSHQELEAGLAIDSPERIGERLVNLHSLSPHAIRIIQLEQMFIRLSQTIRDESYRLEFSQREIAELDGSLDKRHFIPLLNDWIASKVQVDWLQSFFLPWLEHPLMKAENFDKLNLYQTLPLMVQAQESLGAFENKSVQVLLDSAGKNEDAVLKALYMLLLTRVVIFSDRKFSDKDFERKINRLQKMFGNIEKKTHFEILGLAKGARSSEVSRAYHDLAKALHPDKVHPQAPDELRALTEKIFSHITEAYKVLKEDRSRKRYISQLEHGLVEEALESEAKFDNAKQLLAKGRYKDSYKLMKDVMKRKGHRSDAIIYLIWARLKIGPGRMDHQEFMLKIKAFMSEVPHEERHSANYFFIRGLYYKSAGNYGKAIKYLKHAASLDAGFIEAKRELVLVKRDIMGSSQSRASGEISTVITRFFTKKKTRR